MEGQGERWESLRSDLVAAGAVVLPGSPGSRSTPPFGLSDRSTLGAIAIHTGGVVFDSGWIRHYGGDGSPLRSLKAVNQVDHDVSTSLSVAEDVLGGRYAIDGGGLGCDPGEVSYFGPDSLSWVGLGANHTQFVNWLVRGDISSFYGSLRWPGWKDEITGLPLDRGIVSYPPPFASEGSDLASCTRREIPMIELMAFLAHAARHLGDVDGAFTLGFE